MNIEIRLEVPQYSTETGIKYNWEEEFEIESHIKDGVIVIRANKSGLVSLANHCMNLAQEKVPKGHHLHFDDFNSLETGSVDLIIEKS